MKLFFPNNCFWNYIECPCSVHSSLASTCNFIHDFILTTPCKTAYWPLAYFDRTLRSFSARYQCLIYTFFPVSFPGATQRSALYWVHRSSFGSFRSTVLLPRVCSTRALYWAQRALRFISRVLHNVAVSLPHAFYVVVFLDPASANGW